MPAAEEEEEDKKIQGENVPWMCSDLSATHAPGLLMLQTHWHAQNMRMCRGSSAFF